MNQTAKDRVKNLIPIIQAFSEGKIIQEFNTHSSKWNDVNELDFLNFFNLGKSPSIYRIQPEQKYVPFINKEECWAEMHKHPDFGWVKCKETGTYIMVSTIYNSTTIEPPHISIDCCEYTFTDAFNNFCFTDGKPFGVKES